MVCYNIVEYCLYINNTRPTLHDLTDHLDFVLGMIFNFVYDFKNGLFVTGEPSENVSSTDFKLFGKIFGFRSEIRSGPELRGRHRIAKRLCASG